ncbi:MAG: IS110 family transposase [Ruminococcus sp.]|nr:IS110 family transposase [Ruminococcus sp.]
MNYTQNEKILQVGEGNLVVGIDVGSEKHYARVFDRRGIEYTKKAFVFTNDADGFAGLLEWLACFIDKYDANGVIAGMEPTGHYWFDLAKFLEDNGIKPVLVNPLHVKRSKELDDHLPSKNDLKDPKTIAKLVIDGRYAYPYMPQGVYAELRNASVIRFQIEAEQTRIKNRIQRWLCIYFPEYKEVYGNFDAISSLMVLKQAALPCDIIALGADKINQIWRDAKLRAVGKKRAQTLVETAQRSIGHTEGLETARIEISLLLEDYERISERLVQIMELIKTLVGKVPYADKLMQIKGIGMKTVSGFIAEVGDISRFTDPKQIQKLAGQAIVANSSGKHKGRSKISKRGRKRLRYLLFEATLSLTATNPEFREIHRYYTNRKANPLKKKQSLMVLSNKLIRVFYAILKSGTDYDPAKLLRDIRRPEQLQTAA